MTIAQLANIQSSSRRFEMQNMLVVESVKQILVASSSIRLYPPKILKCIPPAYRQPSALALGWKTEIACRVIPSFIEMGNV